MILGVIDWQTVGVIASVAVSALSAILIYTKGRKSDEALQSSNLVQTAFTGQQTLVEALQEEVKRHQDSADRCLKECSLLRTELHEAQVEIRALKRTQASMVAIMKKAGVSYDG